MPAFSSGAEAIGSVTEGGSGTMASMVGRSECGKWGRFALIRLVKAVDVNGVHVIS